VTWRHSRTLIGFRAGCILCHAPKVNHARVAYGVTPNANSLPLSLQYAKVCRSPRLAKTPTALVVKKAQINLCWFFYLLEEEHAPLQEIMNNYITMFYGPLQPHIIVALTTLFGTPTPTTLN